MVIFSNCKINLGLRVTRRRPDGYHDVETVMIPVPWGDVLEILPAEGEDTELISLGIPVDCPPEKNLAMKAYRAVASRHNIPPVRMVLDKIVPHGAGLGGGSADAAAVILGLNRFFSLGMNDDEMASIASGIGADCPFFIYSRPMLASGIGTELTPVDVPAIKGLWLLIVKPESVSISTREAYAGITPAAPEMPLMDALALPIDQWQSAVINDFERSIFPLAPSVAELKSHMHSSGAVYAAMSGSGSAVFGLFATREQADAAAQSLQTCEARFITQL